MKATIPQTRIVEVAKEIAEYQLLRGQLLDRKTKLTADLATVTLALSDAESKRLAAAREMDKLTE